MIAHAIEAALSSVMFQHVVVSTDDDEIAEIALKWGAEVPFRRPPELADDFTPTVPVINHAVEACRQIGWNVEYACCIYPGVPFIQVDDIRGAFDLLISSGAAYSFQVTEFPSAIQRALRRSPEGLMSPFEPKYELVRTQDLEPAFHDVGQFYWASAETWKNNNRIHSSGAGLPIPGWRAVDIDTPADWERAELLYNAINGSSKS